MVTFVSLLIGLVAGTHPVEVAVTGSVAAVELRLDGKTLSVLRGEPWRAEVDFGPDLQPHELVAVAFDQAGQELGRSRQLVNVPRQPVEASFLVQRDASGRPISARLIVGATGNQRPSDVRVTLDGRALVPDEDGCFALSSCDLARPHLLSATVQLTDGEAARADLALGGMSGGEAVSELTAFPVVVEESASAPTVEALQGLVRVGGEPASVAAVERSGSRVLVVPDGAASSFLAELALAQERLGPERMHSDDVLGPERLAPDQDGLRFVVPVPIREGQADLAVDLFPVAGWYSLRPGLLPWMLTHLRTTPQEGQRLADAVALAGVRAAAGGSPRAVVLLSTGAPKDGSRQSAATIRRYLEQLRVPLRVWSTDPDRVSIPGWGEAEDVSSRLRMRQAAQRLEGFLARQWIVWVEGQHLPGSLSLADGAEGLRPVG